MGAALSAAVFDGFDASEARFAESAAMTHGPPPRSPRWEPKLAYGDHDRALLELLDSGTLGRKSTAEERQKDAVTEKFEHVTSYHIDMQTECIDSYVLSFCPHIFLCHE
jgi:hypothetical protein